MSLIVRILQHNFPIKREYTEGHRLTETEATALNQLLIENVRNNVYGWVVKEAQGRSVLTAEQHEDLAQRISAYADRYVFRSRIRAVKPSPLDITIRELALQYAEAWGNQQGHSVDSSEVHAKYKEMQLNPAIHEQARSLIDRRQSIADKALEGLL